MKIKAISKNSPKISNKEKAKLEMEKHITRVRKQKEKRKRVLNNLVKMKNQTCRQ